MKESVTKFDLNAAFKALDEIETPVAPKGIAANRVNLKETLKRVNKTDLLVEDYYDVNNEGELADAKEEREAEVAKAKLARIEKIVDLDAQTADDLLPSYVGKVIIQCPQCMTLFYKNQEDIEYSEDDDTIVNVNETCQHCGNISGYTVIGKVDKVGEEEASQYDTEDFDDNELDLDFEEPEEETEEEVEEEPSEESEDEEAELDLEPVGEEETEEEEIEESVHLNKEFHDINKKNASEHDSENLTLNEDVAADEAAKTDAAEKNIDISGQKNGANQPSNNLADANVAPKKEIPNELQEAIAITIEEVPDSEVTIDCPTECEIPAVECEVPEVECEIPAAECEVSPIVSDVISDAAMSEIVPEIAEEPEATTEVETEVETEVVPEEAPVEPTEEPTEAEPAEEIVTNEDEPANEDEEEDEIEESVNLNKEFHDINKKNASEHDSENLSLNEDALSLDLEKDLSDDEFKELLGSIVKESCETEETVELDECEEIDNDFINEECSVEEAVEDAEDIDEEAVEECIKESLCNVYENVETFKLTNCELTEGALTVTGNIIFKSGKEKETKYVFTEATRSALIGTNSTLAEDSLFGVNFKISQRKLIAESVCYSYKIGENLVEGATNSVLLEKDGWFQGLRDKKASKKGAELAGDDKVFVVYNFDNTNKAKSVGSETYNTLGEADKAARSWSSVTTNGISVIYVCDKEDKLVTEKPVLTQAKIVAVNNNKYIAGTTDSNYTKLVKVYSDGKAVVDRTKELLKNKEAEVAHAENQKGDQTQSLDNDRVIKAIKSKIEAIETEGKASAEIEAAINGIKELKEYKNASDDVKSAINKLLAPIETAKEAAKAKEDEAQAETEAKEKAEAEVNEKKAAIEALDEADITTKQLKRAEGYTDKFNVSAAKDSKEAYNDVKAFLNPSMVKEEGTLEEIDDLMKCAKMISKMASCTVLISYTGKKEDGSTGKRGLVKFENGEITAKKFKEFLLQYPASIEEPEHDESAEEPVENKEDEIEF